MKWVLDWVWVWFGQNSQIRLISWSSPMTSMIAIFVIIVFVEIMIIDFM